MKRVFSICFLLLLAIPLFGACSKETSQFALSTYERYLEEFPSDISVGTIKNASDAKQKALTVWLELFGTHVKRQRPYKVFYDPNSKTWLVTGSTPLLYRILPSAGGTANIVFQEEDGNVLAVWHDK